MRLPSSERLAPPGQPPPGQPLLPSQNTAPSLGRSPQTGCQSTAGCPGRVNLVVVDVFVLPSFLHTSSPSRRWEKIERLSHIIPHPTLGNFRQKPCLRLRQFFQIHSFSFVQETPHCPVLCIALLVSMFS